MEHEEKSEFEELSAWIDNEDSYLSEDQQKSAESKKVAEDFKKIDSAISKTSAAATPSPELIAQISAKCSGSKETIHFSRHFYRIAVIAAACLVVTFLYKDQDKKNDELNQVVETQAEKKSIPELKSLDKENESKLEALRGNPSPATPSGEFNLIGTNTKEDVTNAISLEEEIKHVWVSEKPQETALQLLKMAGNLNPVDSKVDAKGNVSFTISISDNDLVNIVDKLNESGNALVSKEFPQPNQINKVSISGKTINYKVSILKKN